MWTTKKITLPQQALWRCHRSMWCYNEDRCMQYTILCDFIYMWGIQYLMQKWSKVETISWCYNEYPLTNIFFPVSKKDLVFFILADFFSKYLAKLAKFVVIETFLKINLLIRMKKEWINYNIQNKSIKFFFLLHIFHTKFKF